MKAIRISLYAIAGLVVLLVLGVAVFAMTFNPNRYKPEIDPEKVPQFGLVAEQVEKVNPDLVVHDHSRKPLTVRCEAVMRCCLMSSMRA